MAGTTDTTQETLEAWRQAMFEEMGFEPQEAEALGNAEQTVIVNTQTGTRQYQVALDYWRVRKLLRAGATKAQILRIFL